MALCLFFPPLDSAYVIHLTRPQLVTDEPSKLTTTELLDGLHASPAHAVLLHKDIRSRHSLGMHFATFAGSEVEAIEPLLELDQAREKYEVGDWQAEGGFGTLDVGQTAVISLESGKLSD